MIKTKALVANLLILGLFFNVNAWSKDSEVDSLCQKIGRKLSSVSSSECRRLNFSKPRFYSVNGLPVLEKHFPAAKKAVNPPKILFIGGIHGDEYSSVSVTFKWLKTLKKYHSGAYDWHFVPVVNPDGLLKKKSTRVNANGVDLNRNFLVSQGEMSPINHWTQNTKQRKRYYPGRDPLSEPESKMIYQLIDEIKPNVIISVHAPHGILDFDGSITPPKRLGPLRLRQLGTYPGSLGNYGFNVKGIPVMTIELKYAGIMPKPKQVSKMWVDLVGWIRRKTDSRELVAYKE